MHAETWGIRGKVDYVQYNMDRTRGPSEPTPTPSPFEDTKPSEEKEETKKAAREGLEMQQKTKATAISPMKEGRDARTTVYR